MDHHKKKLFGTATVGTKGQVVIPAEAREELNIQPGDRLYVVGVGKGTIGFLKEEVLDHIVQRMSTQVEDLKGFKINEN